MPNSRNLSRRSVYTLLLLFAVVSLILLMRWPTGSKHDEQAVKMISNKDGLVTHERESGTEGLAISHELLSGEVVMPKLGNETAKAELGRAAWKLFHTTFARFPEKPTADQKATLRAWTHLFQRMYPCGECASHFRIIIDKFPPQVSSRNAAAAWGCHVHNEVNKSLQKPVFDCANIGDFYDCGCADDDESVAQQSDEKGSERTVGSDGSVGRQKIKGIKGGSTAERLIDGQKADMSAERIEKLTGSRGREFNGDLLRDKKDV